MTFTYGYDLFGDGNKVIVIPTNSVGVQGAGLAKMAAQRWPRWSAWYRRQCESGHVTPGQVKMWCGEENGHESGLPILLSVATKDHWRFPSQLSWIERGLCGIEAALTMAHGESSAQNVLHGRGRLKQGTRVGIPALGCGYGGVDYALVRPKIEAVADRLGGVGYVVTLYVPQ